MKSKLKLFSLFIILIISSCNRSETEKTTVYADDLRNAIDLFEQNRVDFSEDVSDIVEITDKKLSKDEPNLVKISKEWEEKWLEITEKFNALNEEFINISEKSAPFFNALDTIVLGINDAELRKSQINSNNILKEKWQTNYDIAQTTMNQIEKLIGKGNDYSRVLIATSIRQALEENIEELKTISESAKSLLAELQKFSLEGKKIIG